jgi:hypothetical protein
LLHLADATFVETSKTASSRQTAVKDFIIMAVLLNLRTNHSLIGTASGLRRLRGEAKGLTGDVNVEATSRAQFVSKSRSFVGREKSGVEMHLENASQCPVPKNSRLRARR